MTEESDWGHFESIDRIITSDSMPEWYRDEKGRLVFGVRDVYGIHSSYGWGLGYPDDEENE